MAEVYRVGYGDGSVIRSASPHVCARVQRHRQTASGSYLILPHPTTTCRGCVMIRYDGCGSILPYPTPFLCPTLDCSAIIPYHTLSYILLRPSYHNQHWISTKHLTTTFFVLHWIFNHLTLSYTILHPFFYPHPTSYQDLLCPTLQPSHLILPRPTTNSFVLNWVFQPNILPQPSSSYTGSFNHPTLSYLIHEQSSV